MKRLNICIDIDGTITDPYHFLPYLNNICDKEMKPEDWTTYNWDILYGKEISELLSIFHTDYIKCYGEAEVVQYAKEVIEELNIDNNLYFVTARSSVLEDITRKWLDDKGFNSIDVHLLGSDYKIEKARELECTIFIEDNPANALQLANEGIKVLLINTNYNTNLCHENITRVNHWNDIKDYVLSYNI